MRITVEDVIEAVCAQYRMSKSELLGQQKDHYVAHPRQVAYLLCREYTEASLPRIGLRFGGRDHSTVMKGIIRVNDRLGRADRAINKHESIAVARLQEIMDERKAWDFDRAYEHAWRTWAFVHRASALGRAAE